MINCHHSPSGVVIGSYILLLWSAGIWGPFSCSHTEAGCGGLLAVLAV